LQKTTELEDVHRVQKPGKGKTKPDINKKKSPGDLRKKSNAVGPVKVPAYSKRKSGDTGTTRGGGHRRSFRPFLKKIEELPPHSPCQRAQGLFNKETKPRQRGDYTCALSYGTL